MDKISRFIVWLCSKFSREQLEFINKELSDILQGRKEFPVENSGILGEFWEFWARILRILGTRYFEFWGHDT